MNWQKIPPLRQLGEKARHYRQALRFRRTVQQSLGWHHTELDPQDAQKSSSPEGENIELHCVWVTEAYTPSCVDGLITSLKKRGWDKAEYNVGFDTSLVEQIQHARSASNQTSWVNAGVILSPSDTRFLGAQKRFAKLPPGVDYCSLSLRTVTSSLTLITIQFVLTDEYARALNGLLTAHYQTKAEYYPSVWKSTSAAFTGVIEQKRQAVTQRREHIHHGLYAWFSHTLPGHFASLGGTAYPTVDLITSRTYAPPTDGEWPPYGNYLDIVLGTVTETWRCKDDANLELRLPGYGGGDQPLATLFGNYDKLTADTERYGGTDRAALTNKLDREFDGTAALWATHYLLVSYEQALAGIRDRASSRALSVRQVLRDMAYIHRQYLAVSRDVQAVSKDIAAFASSPYFYSHGALDFSPPARHGDGSDFVELQRVQDEDRAKQLDVLEAQVSRTVLASGDLATALANLRIQRYVVWLTVAAVIFALGSLLIAVATLLKP